MIYLMLAKKCNLKTQICEHHYYIRDHDETSPIATSVPIIIWLMTVDLQALRLFKFPELGVIEKRNLDSLSGNFIAVWLEGGLCIL